MKRTITEWIYEELGDNEYDEFPSPPGSNQITRFGELDKYTGEPLFVASTQINDGFDIGIGYPHKWLIILSFEEAMELVKFVVWDWWVIGQGFGVKRRLWYWALRIMLESSKGETL